MSDDIFQRFFFLAVHLCLSSDKQVHKWNRSSLSGKIPKEEFKRNLCFIGGGKD
jgi:hypothetical protein